MCESSGVGVVVSKCLRDVGVDGGWVIGLRVFYGRRVRNVCLIGMWVELGLIVRL